MPFKIVRNDITKMEVDAIVNTANEKVCYGEGIDTAVYKAAGEEQLLAARRVIGDMKEGETAITPGFQLPCAYIIHAVSPRYVDGHSGEAEKLRSCYRGSLKLAKEKGCKSMAFPLISTGSYGYPKEEAMRIAVDEIHAFLLKDEMQIYLVVFDQESSRLGHGIYPDLESYIDRNYVEEQTEKEYHGSNTVPAFLFRSTTASLSRKAERAEGRFDLSAESAESLPYETHAPEEDYDSYIEEKESALDIRIRHLADSFQQYLFYLIETKNLSNAEVYKRAIITKQTFSKIKVKPEYHPDKSTAMRLCVGAKLNLDETRDLLARAGFALSPCDKRDIIFSYFIEKEIYDMIEIDIALEEHGLPCFIE